MVRPGEQRQACLIHLQMAEKIEQDRKRRNFKELNLSEIQTL